jgi:hypothetical protein
MAFSLLMKIDAIYMTRPFLWIGVNNLTALWWVQVIPINHFHSI